jgi:hypothetical protein
MNKLMDGIRALKPYYQFKTLEDSQREKATGVQKNYPETMGVLEGLSI